MRIELKFFAGLRDYLPGDTGTAQVELPVGAIVADALARYGVPEDKPRILLVNGRHAAIDTELHDEDVLSVFPPVAGG